MGSGEVVDFDLRGILSAAGSSTGDHGNFVIPAGGEEMNFGAGGIDGVEDDVGFFLQQNFVRGALAVERLPDNYFDFRVDGAKAIGEDGGFGFADGLGDSVDLTVDIGNAEIIEVDEGEISNSRTCQGLSDPGTHTAETDNHGVAVGEILKDSLAVESADSSETIEVVVSHGDFLADKWIEQKRRMRY